MAIYTRKCEQKSLKINNRGGWNKDVPGEKKIERLTVGAGVGGTIIRYSRVDFQRVLCMELEICNFS